MEDSMSYWTANDIEILTVFYTKGLPIKEISKRLNRSPTALHKAISRFKLNPLKSESPLQSSEEKWQTNTIKKGDRKKSYIQKIFHKCMNEYWVSFNEVIDYLSEKGISVVHLNRKNNDNEDLYALNNKIFIATQVLLVANRLRIDEKKTPFKVERVSF